MPNPPEIGAKPNDQWNSPLNFDTHKDYFGPGLGQEGGEVKQAMYDTLKEAVQAKA